MGLWHGLGYKLPDGRFFKDSKSRGDRPRKGLIPSSGTIFHAEVKLNQQEVGFVHALLL